MSTPYAEKRDNGYWVAGTRVSLDSIVYAYWGGQTAESIAQSFPVLTHEQVYGAILFYLANRREVKAKFEAIRQTAHKADPMFYQKLADAHRAIDTSHQ
jgi:uncharacterized protein (DUF433 family)